MNGDEMELFDQALDEGWGAPNGPGHATQFMNSAGLHGMQVGVAQGEMEIHDLIYEDELSEEEEDPSVQGGCYRIVYAKEELQSYSASLMRQGTEAVRFY
ncbi:hypothetical protein ACET3Z_023968 [Daucus carota]